MWTMEECVDDFVMACLFKNLEDDFCCTFIRVYGLNIDFEKTLSWEELTSLLAWWQLPSCLRDGDFNVTHFPIEKLGGPTLLLL